VVTLVVGPIEVVIVVAPPEPPAPPVPGTSRVSPMNVRAPHAEAVARARMRRGEAKERRGRYIEAVRSRLSAPREGAAAMEKRYALASFLRRPSMKISKLDLRVPSGRMVFTST